MKRKQNITDYSIEMLNKLAQELGIPEKLMEYSEFRNYFAIIIRHIVSIYGPTPFNPKFSQNPIVKFINSFLKESEFPYENQLDIFVSTLSQEEADDFLNKLLNLIENSQYLPIKNPDELFNHNENLLNAAIKVQDESVTFQQINIISPNNIPRPDKKILLPPVYNYLIRQHFFIDDDGNLNITSQHVTDNLYSYINNKMFTTIDQKNGKKEEVVLTYNKGRRIYTRTQNYKWQSNRHPYRTYQFAVIF